MDLPTEERRCLQIFIENRNWGDRVLMYRIARLLRQYADMIDRGEAGDAAIDVFCTDDGFVMTVMGGPWNGKALLDVTDVLSSRSKDSDQSVPLLDELEIQE